MSSFYPAPSLTFMLTGKIFFHKLEVVHEVVQNWTGSFSCWPGGPLTRFPGGVHGPGSMFFIHPAWSAGFNLALAYTTS